MKLGKANLTVSEALRSYYLLKPLRPLEARLFERLTNGPTNTRNNYYKISAAQLHNFSSGK